MTLDNRIDELSQRLRRSGTLNQSTIELENDRLRALLTRAGEALKRRSVAYHDAIALLSGHLDRDGVHLHHHAASGLWEDCVVTSCATDRAVRADIAALETKL